MKWTRTTSLLLISIGSAPACGDSAGSGSAGNVPECAAGPTPWRDIPNECRYEITMEGSVIASGECDEREGVSDNYGNDESPTAALSLKQRDPRRMPANLFEISIAAQHHWQDMAGKSYEFLYNNNGEVDVSLLAQEHDDGSGEGILKSLNCSVGGKKSDPVSLTVRSAEPVCYLEPYMSKGVGPTFYVVHGTVQANCHADVMINGKRESVLVDVKVEL